MNTPPLMVLNENCNIKKHTHTHTHMFTSIRNKLYPTIGNKYFLRVIPTLALTHYSDIVSDIPFGSVYCMYYII